MESECLDFNPGCATYDFPGGSDGKASAYNAGDPGSIPWSGRSPGEVNGCEDNAGSKFALALFSVKTLPLCVS